MLALDTHLLCYGELCSREAWARRSRRRTARGRSRLTLLSPRRSAASAKRPLYPRTVPRRAMAGAVDNNVVHAADAGSSGAEPQQVRQPSPCRRSEGGPPLCVYVILATVWPVVAVIAVRSLLAQIEKLQGINDVKNVEFTSTTCDLLVGSGSVVQECCRTASVGSCVRCGGPDERDCSCEHVAKATVCGPGELIGALENHWGDDNLQGGNCTHACKSVYAEDCAEDNGDANARLASWIGNNAHVTTVPCFVSAAGHVRLAPEAASARYSGILFMCLWVAFWMCPYYWCIANACAKVRQWPKKRRKSSKEGALVSKTVP